MSRKTIYDLIAENILSPAIALGRIRYTFMEKPLDEYVPIDTGTLYDLSKRDLVNSPILGSCINLDDFIINTLYINLHQEDNINFDDVFRLIELVYLCLDNLSGDAQAQIGEGFKHKLTLQINEVLDKTNHQIYQSEQGKIVVLKNKEAELAASLISEDNKTIHFLDYLHYSNNGDLDTKRKILRQLGHFFEPQLKSKSPDSLKDLKSDIGFILNNFNIRHHQNASYKKYCSKMTDDKLEILYDDLYALFINLVISTEAIKIHQQLKLIKKESD